MLIPDQSLPDNVAELRGKILEYFGNPEALDTGVDLGLMLSGPTLSLYQMVLLLGTQRVIYVWILTMRSIVLAGAQFDPSTILEFNQIFSMPQ